MTSPAIARHLRRPLSTVGAVLRRRGLGRLAALEPRVAARRYERERVGESIHVDIKKLGRIDGVGHRITGDRQVCTIRIELLETDPLIWRQVEVPTSITLKVLHDIVQITMAWLDDHYWEFTIGKQIYGLPKDEIGAPPRASTPPRCVCATC